MNYTNRALTATFDLNTYTITSSATQCTINPLGATVVNYGANQGYTITPVAGRHLQVVTVDGVSQGAVGSYTFTNVTADHSIDAQCAINQYNIATSVAGAGTLSCSANPVDWGTDSTCTATPDPGHYVVNLSADAVSQGAVNQYTFTNVQADHAISATFGINASCLSFTPNSHDFGDVALGATAGPVTITVANCAGATASATITAQTLTGPDADDILLSNGTCVIGVTTLSAGQSCTFNASVIAH
jgi:hypothetical protein